MIFHFKYSVLLYSSTVFLFIDTNYNRPQKFIGFYGVMFEVSREKSHRQEKNQ